MNTVNGRYDPETGAVEIDVPGNSPRTVSVDVADTRRRDVVVGSRPEDTEVIRGADDKRAWFTATVDFVGFHGANKFVFLQPTDDVEIIARVGSDTALTEGDVASVRFDPGCLHLYDARSGERIPTTCQVTEEPE